MSYGLASFLVYAPRESQWSYSLVGWRPPPATWGASLFLIQMYHAGVRRAGRHASRT
ncbi:hypothetical protein SBA4_710009 [Candidatus Sulfopaludibacter sp. SbA4]|nr:hypothetical protein SBA4_710009 [Candidatus Sulfopaludibacter sp. SbA4]